MYLPKLAFLQVLGLFLIASGFGDELPKDLISGKFVLTSSLSAPDYKNFLAALDYTPAFIEELTTADAMTVDIKRPLRNVYEYVITIGKHKMTNRFESGVPFEETLFDGRKVKVTMTIQFGSVLFRDVHCPDAGYIGRHVAVFTKDGFETLYVAVKKAMMASAVQVFKRTEWH